ncbi:MAG: LysM peptidoglycan-binding domain-containing protein [Chloroflexi bacterium]|nr:CAP domain-containing protein [Chloroflexota bacterium]MQC26861.1 LysM peptidoglycan-binding domain-containing protein [Chloroflexota bacterium]
MSRSKIILLLIIIALLPAKASVAYAAPHKEPRASAAEVFGLINNYRTSNGVPALSQNSILMQTAQGQSDYQASIGQVTHGGPGSSRPIDRAYAAGYGGGQVIFISELITGGSNQSPQGALTWWQNSSEHNYYLLNADYVELGIGVASDGNGRIYYTAVMGHIAGGTSYVPDKTDAGSPVVAQPVTIPVIKATPRDNGALVHIVRQGQALWTISAVYEVPLETILALNNLTLNSFIFPGDEIILKEADPPTPTPEPATLTPRPTRTPVPTVTPLLLASQVHTASNGAGSSAGDPLPSQINASQYPESENASVRLIILLALASIIAVFLASFFIQRKAPEEVQSEIDPFAPVE